MATGTLYTYPDSFRAYKILIAAQYSGADVKVASQPPEFKFGETNKTDDFLQKFPLGKVPAYEDKNGLRLFESNAIAHYVGNDALRGAAPEEAAQVQQWVNFADNEILPASCTWVFPCLGLMQYNKQNTEHAKEDIKKALGVLNKHLETRTYLVGERISQADITVAVNLLQLYQNVLDPEFRKPFVNTNRWFNTIINQPQVKSVVGDVKLCVKMAQFDAKKFAELQGQKGGQKKEGKQGKKQEQAKKQEKTKQEKAEEAPKEEPKPKDPFAVLPGDFDMDAFKRTYSNEEKIAIPYFWEKFEPEKANYSIWYCEYKYPEELEMTFMSCNLIGGMMQRLDKMRKYAFGSMILFGEDNKSTISGVWFWKGQGLAFELHDSLTVDYEVYDWKKLDPDSEETKKMVSEYFLLEGDFGGKKFNQAKIFK